MRMLNQGKGGHTRLERYISEGNICLGKFHFDFVIFILAFLVNCTRKLQDLPCGIEVIFRFPIFPFSILFITLFFCNRGLTK
jgi:hypothetical protein